MLILGTKIKSTNANQQTITLLIISLLRWRLFLYFNYFVYSHVCEATSISFNRTFLCIVPQKYERRGLTRKVTNSVLIISFESFISTSSCSLTFLSQLLQSSPLLVKNASQRGQCANNFLCDLSHKWHSDYYT